MERASSLRGPDGTSFPNPRLPAQKSTPSAAVFWIRVPASLKAVAENIARRASLVSLAVYPFLCLVVTICFFWLTAVRSFHPFAPMPLFQFELNSLTSDSDKAVNRAGG